MDAKRIADQQKAAKLIDQLIADGIKQRQEIDRLTAENERLQRALAEAAIRLTDRERAG